jgi:hypothetical protein
MVVALFLLQLVAVAVASALILTHRVGRDAARHEAIDLARRDTVASRLADSACRHAPAAEARSLILPAAPGRAPIEVVLRCGR